MRVGNESLIGQHMNDKIGKYLEDTYIILKSIDDSYMDKHIKKKEYEKQTGAVAKDFMKTIKERFGFNIKLIFTDNLFAVIPLLNMDTKTFNLDKEAKKGIKEIKNFRKYLEQNDILIDLKKPYIHVPDKFEIPLFIGMCYLKEITKQEFAAIVLHEIGHVFTYLEYYGKHLGNNQKLVDSLLQENSAIKTAKELKVTLKEDAQPTESNMIVSIYEKIDPSKDVRLGGDGNGDFDMENQADEFAIKFGYGKPLTTGLNKLALTSSLSMTKITLITGIFNIWRLYIGALILSSFASVAFMTIAIGLAMLSLMVRLAIIVNKTKNTRNPIDDEHGSLADRMATIKIRTISILRSNKELPNSLRKKIMSDLETIEKEMAKLENSPYDSVLVALMGIQLTSNLNRREQLDMIVDRAINNKLYVSQNKFLIMANEEEECYKKYMDNKDIYSDMITLVNEKEIKSKK